MPVPASPPVESRIYELDGLRGILVTLVVLHHGWTLWPTDSIDDNWFLRGWFEAGNFAVSVFFVLGSFVVTRSLLRRAAADALRPSVAFARRAIRLGGQMYLVLIAVMVVSVFDSTDQYSDTATTQSVLHAATFTFNWYVQNPDVASRPDLGHLWYLSVDLQVFVVVLALVWLLRRHVRWLIVTLAAMFFMLAFWRYQIYQDQGTFIALLRTVGRADAPIAGALAAAAVPFIKLADREAKILGLVGAAALVPLMFVTGDLDNFFGFPGVLVDLAVCALLVGVALAPAHRIVTAVLTRRVLRFLGRYALGIYLWHYPIFWFVARHGIEWNWGVRVLVAGAITTVMVTVGQVMVERRVTRVLDSPQWGRTNDGLAAYAIREARSRWEAGQTSR